MTSRRQAVGWLLAALPGLVLGSAAAAKGVLASRHPLLKRAIPSSGEMLPVIGLGTARTFNVAAGDAQHADAVLNVLKQFHDAGAEVIDVAPPRTVSTFLIRSGSVPQQPAKP